LRVLVASDSHLSPRSPEAGSNWAAVAREAGRLKPELVVHAGDLTLDGIGTPEELAWARARLDELPVPWAAVPGNHDIGDTPGPPQLDLDRLEAWRGHIGPDRWSLQLGAWTLLGLNAHLFDSNLSEETEQWTWIEQQLAEQPRNRPVALILHKPLTAPDAELSAAPRYRFVMPGGRARLLELLASRWCPLVVSGHVHQYRLLGDRHRRHAWAPTSWAVLPDSAQANVGLKRSGVLSLELEPGGSVRVELLEPAGLAQLTIGEDIVDPYQTGS